MKTLFNSIRGAAHKRLAYERTVSALESMPLDVALDLDINRADARKIAHRAVYGR